MTGDRADFGAEIAKCTGLDDPRWRAVELIADAWQPALDRSYRLGYEIGYNAGRWGAEHEMFLAWHKVALDVIGILAQPTRDELATLRGETR